MPDLAEALKSALNLNADDRAAVAERLLASLDDLDEEESDRLWALKASNRLDVFRAGRGRLARMTR
jgi:2-oxo-4-hydroxy-4-carboxy--5-ureidoimidazoline (OHCU) decarboxylase